MFVDFMIGKILMETGPPEPSSYENGRRVLFPDTEILEDVAQDLVGGYFTGDLTQEVEHFADVLGQKVGGKGRDESL